MAITVICGLETGDGSQLANIIGTASVQATTKRTGGYALKVNPTTTSTGYGRIDTVGAVYSLRFYFYAQSIPSAAEQCLQLASTANSLDLFLNSNGTIEAKRSGASKGISAAISAATWYRIDVKWTNGAQAVSLNGTGFATDTQATDSNGLFYFGKVVNTNGASVEFYYDDVLISNSGADYPLGAGKSIARQPGAGLGTPTVNAWTKSTGTDAGALWGNTPFSAASFCTASTSAAQLSFISPFSAGTNAIVSGDTINACQVALIAKTSATSAGGTNLLIQRFGTGVSGTDTALTLTTSDAYYAETTPWTATLANLDAMQAGAYTSASTRIRTVEDVWVFVDYTPSAGTSVNLTGQQATVSGGLLTQVGGGTVAQISNGAQATSAGGLLAVNHAQALTGQGLAGAQGTLTPAISVPGTSVNLIGLQATAAQGAFVTNHAQALTGQQATGAQGSVVSGKSQALTGQQASVAQGSVATLHSNTLTGQAATIGRGDLTVPAGAGVSIVAHFAAQGDISGTADAGGINTTGATGIYVGSCYLTGFPPTISDSKGNTWLLVDWQGGSVEDAVLYYAENPIVGAGHTFSALAADSYASIAVLAASGIVTSASLDKESKAAATATSVATGIVSPASDNELLVTVLAAYERTSDAAIDSGFTISDQLPLIGGVSFDIALAYQIQTTATAKNPSWVWTTTSTAETVIGTWFGTAGGGGGGASAGLTGLAATTQQGALTASANRSATLAGQLVTASGGTLTSGAGGAATATGLGATTAQGSLANKLHSNALTGQEATAGQGSLAVLHNNALTGQAAAVERGDVGTTAGGSATLAGQAVTVSRGAFQVNISVPIEVGDEHALSGLQANTAQGTPATLHSNNLTGQAASAQAGLVTAVHVNTGTLTGLQVSVTGGLVGTQHSNALTGQQATAQQGNASAGSAGISTLAGLTATASQGALRPDHQNAIAGLQAATAAGTVTPARSYAVAPVGRELTAGQGSVGTQHSNTLAGQAASAQQGTLIAARTSQALTGQQVTATAGNVGTQHSQALDGQQATTAGGTLTAGAIAASPVAGLQATVGRGSLSVLHSNTLTGQAATAQRGTLTGVVAGGTALTGLQATAQQGQLSASWSISIVLTGQQATAAAGALETHHSQALVGRQAQVQRGLVSVSIPGEDTLAGQQATAQTGVLFPELQVPIEGLPAVELVGQQCVVEQGTMTPIGGTIVLFPGIGGKYCNHDDDGRVSSNGKGRRLCHDNEDVRLKVNER